ncbi:hypothetical protein TWF788_002493 [Orbilia oligospora]|uniref:DNA replication checkpoint mediator MRC1 domain-containing protein n=1 Tax=Orbilia oligospora TaxID=2813651 RepID=A0A7C8NYW6_ORBOL|nr:hypothetical protein TWF788_002493 [Orbilia oligospora]
MSSPTPSLSSREYRSPSPPQSPKLDFSLTPKSKLKALLAQFSDSDDEPTSKRVTTTRRGISVNMDDDDDEDDEEDVPVARSRARATKIIGSDDEDEDVEMEDVDANIPSNKINAADRLRQQLSMGTLEKETTPEPDQDDEDGETTPKPARRRILKKKQSPIQSPVTSPIRVSDSESLDLNAIDFTIKPKKQKKTEKGKGKASEKKKKSKKSKKLVVAGSGSGSEPNPHGSDSDDASLGSLDEDENAFIAESRLQQLVNQKRKANKKKEDEEEAKRQARLEASDQFQDADLMFSDESGGEAGKKQRKKPAARKASKKALFEMRAETQRMARNQEFNLEPIKKVVHSVDSLWVKFGLVNPNAKPEPVKVKIPPPEPSSSVPVTSQMEQSSPPTTLGTSPTAKVNNEEAQREPLVGDDDDVVVQDDDDDFPTLEQLMAEPQQPKKEEPVNKGKEKAVDKDIEMLDLPKGKKLGFASLPKNKAGNKRKPFVEFVVPATSSQDPDDSDELEILPPQPKKPVAKSDPLKDLKRLANQGADRAKLRGRYAKGPVRDDNWQGDLIKKAKQQIKADEAAKRESFRKQGLSVPTQEEIIKEASYKEDLVEKARIEALEQKDKERREEARRRGIKLADLSDSDDEDYEGSGSEDDDEEDGVAFSGSESEGEEEEEVADEDMGEAEQEDESASPPSAQRSSSPIRLSSMREMAESDDEDALESAISQSRLRRRGRPVVNDEDEEDEDEEGDRTITQIPSLVETPKKAVSFGTTELPMGLTQMFNSSTPSQVVSPVKDQSKIFGGLGNQPPVMGLTQMFDSQGDSQPANPFANLQSDAPVLGLTQMFNSQAASQTSPQKDNPFSALGNKAPVMGLTQMFESSMDGGDAGNRMDILRGNIPEDLNISQVPLDMNIRSSPKFDSTQNNSLLDLEYSQSQIEYEPESLLGDGLALSTQMSFAPEPDMGFQYNPKDAPPRFRESSQATIVSDYHRGIVQSGLTEATVLLSPEPSMPRKKKGRLVRKNRVDGSEKGESDAEGVNSGSEEQVDAFSVLGKKSKKVVETYDKKASGAKNMFQEAAEESEDEYAGLGGGSDDEETDEEALAEMEDMIDNETKDEDDGAHAELDLKRAVAEDEKMIQKVMKDVKNKKLGKRGGYDLDDDSEDEARDRMLRRQKKNEAERRRILMMDDNIAKLDHNPKRQAFLKTIEQTKGERNFLDDEDEDDEYDFAVHEDSQTPNEEQESIIQVPDSQSGGESAPLSNQPVIEVPDSQQMVAETPHGHKIGNPRRTGPSKKRKQHAQLLVQRTVSSLLDDGTDRYQAEGGSDSDSDLEIESYEEITKRRKVNFIDRVAVKRGATTTSETAKLAFHQGNTDPTGQFRLPLLRRTTTNDISETTTVAPKAAFVETTTKMSRGKASGASINFQAREATRQKNLEKATNSSGRRREEKKVMGARRADAANIFNAGGFS